MRGRVRSDPVPSLPQRLQMARSFVARGQLGAGKVTVPSQVGCGPDAERVQRAAGHDLAKGRLKAAESLRERFKRLVGLPGPDGEFGTSLHRRRNPPEIDRALQQALDLSQPSLRFFELATTNV